MSRVSGLTAIDCNDPFAERPILIYWVCIVLTRSSATLPIVSNSDLNSLLNVFVEPAANLKYSLVENLFLSKESVNDSVVLFISLMPAENLPVALIELIKLLCKSCCAVAVLLIVLRLH
jgi:hypothetical protein